MAIVVAVAVLASYTWARWGSLRIDCGREVYVPAQLGKGELLYRDLWYPYGPLAPYLQALVLRVAGVRLEALYVFGIAISGGYALLLYRLARRLLEPLPAFLVCCAFLLQGFAPRLFNFVFGYTYAASLGALLGLASLLLLVRHVEAAPAPNLLLSALVAGLALLCKQEFGIACWSTIAFALGMRLLFAGGTTRFGRELLACLPGAALAIAVFAWFAWKLSPAFLFYENFQVTPGSVFFRAYGSLWVRQHGLRFVPLELAMTIVTALLALAAWYVVVRAAGIGMLRRERWRVLLAVVGAVALAGYGLLLKVPDPYRMLTIFPVGMFWMTLALGAWSSLRFALEPRSSRPLVAAAVACYGLAAGVRVMVQMEPSGYAIYYDTIPFLAFVYCLTLVIERASLGLDAARRSWLAAAVPSLVGLALSVFLFPQLDPRKVPLRTSVGLIYANPAEAEGFAAIAAFMREQAALGRSVAVMPDEVFLYVFSGTAAPARWYQLTPGILGEEQERAYIEALERQHVDYVILTNRRTPELGVPYFGLDYYRVLYGYLQSRYRSVGQFGTFERSPTAPFSALLLARRPLEAGREASLDVPERPQPPQHLGIEHGLAMSAVSSDRRESAQALEPARRP